MISSNWQTPVILAFISQPARLRARAVAAILFTAAASPGSGAEPDQGVAALDDQQQQTIVAVREALIERIAAMKEQYPALENFGDGDSLVRHPWGFTYQFRIRKPAGNRPWIASPNGCAIVFRMAAHGTGPGEFEGLVPASSFGGGRAGIVHDLRILVPNPEVRDLINAIQAANRSALDLTFEPLAAEYVLRKAGIATDTDSLLDSLVAGKSDLALQAATALRPRSLDPKQLSRFETFAGDPAVPLDATLEVVRLVAAKAPEHAPRVFATIASRAIRAEREGTDESHASPAFGQGSDSVARGVRNAIIESMRTAGDSRFIPVASLLIGEDPDPSIRLSALKLLENLPSPDTESVLIASLGNTDRSIQAQAARMVADRKIPAALPAVRSLLASHSSLVRKSAADAVTALGSTPDFTPRTLPDSARAIAAALWDHGLAERDVIRIASHPPDSLFESEFPGNLPTPLPPGIVIKRREGVDSAGKVWVHHYLQIEDSWRIERCDRESIRKRATQYEIGFGLDRSWSWLDPAGPFLLAAAVRLNDKNTALRIYERMCDVFENDDQVLERGLTGIAWERFAAALDAYTRKDDGRAGDLFRKVIAFEDAARPFTAMKNYVTQSKALLSHLDSIKPSAPAPPESDRAATIRHWISRIPEINGVMPGQPASPAIFYEMASKISDIPQPPFASDRLREIGVEAIPYLAEIADDPTPTRTVGYWRDFEPSRYVMTVGKIAQEVLVAICGDLRIDLPKELQGDPFGARRGPIAAKLKKWAASLTVPARAD